MEKILVTGNLGYIGAIVTQDLLDQNYDVKGIDVSFYNEKPFYPFTFSKNFTQVRKDIRDLELEDLKDVDFVIHLAALSNDPLGQLNPKLTDIINLQASLRLAKLAKKANVSRFLFSSSCSIYGQTQDQTLNESSSMNPLSAYAHSKVNLERELMKIAESDFSPIFLRNGTAYGVSPYMRFDLVINNLMGWAFTTNEIKILSDGRSWRPIVHIKDISNAFIAALKAPLEDIHNQAFNVGTNSENYQVKDMAEKIHNVMKDCEIKILGKDNPDQRNYNVNFDKINDTLEYFKPQWNLEKGIIELYEKFKEVNLTKETFEERHYTRIKQLRFLIENNLVDKNLKWN